MLSKLYIEFENNFVFLFQCRALSILLMLLVILIFFSNEMEILES